MMATAENELDMDGSLSDIEGKIENECLRRTSRIRYCSRKMLEAQALLKDKVKETKSEVISRRRSLDDAVKIDESDSLKQLIVPDTISSSNNLENLVIPETKVENKVSKSNVKRSNSLDSGTSKMKTTILSSQEKIETNIICLGKSKNEKTKIANNSQSTVQTDEISYMGKSKYCTQESKEKTVDSLKISEGKVQKSFKRKMQKDKPNIQKTRKKLKPNDIKINNATKNIKSNDKAKESKKAIMKKESIKVRSKRSLYSKTNNVNKQMCNSSDLKFIEKNNDQPSKEDSSTIAIDFNNDKALQNNHHTNRKFGGNNDIDKKGTKEKLRSLRMKNDFAVNEDELLACLAVDNNNETNIVKTENILETENIIETKNIVKKEKLIETVKKKPKKSKVAVSQTKLSKIKLMNLKENVDNCSLVVKKKKSKPPIKVSNISKKYVKGKKTGASRILKKKNVVHNVATFTKQKKQNSLNKNTQNFVENQLEDNSCRSIIITEFSSLLSKYGAIKLSATKKKLGIVPKAFLNLELVMAAINCQYFGFEEVFLWISKCLKLKNVALTQTIENQFRLFEKFFNHMSQSNMTNEDEEEWSKLRVKYYNLPVHSQTSWALVFGYTPNFCNNINFESTLAKATSISQEEISKETFDISLNGFKMEITEKKNRTSRETKNHNTVVSMKSNTKDNSKPNVPMTKDLVEDTIINKESNTKNNSRSRIPMVKIHGYVPEISTKKLSAKSNCNDMKLENNASSIMKNKTDITSCMKSIENRSKTVLNKVNNKDQNKTIRSKRIQLKDTLWNSKKKNSEKINEKSVIEAKVQSEITTKDNIQKIKTEMVETSENPKVEVDNNLESSVIFESCESINSRNESEKDDKASKKNYLKSKILKEKDVEKSAKRKRIENKEAQQVTQFPLSKDFKIDDSHFSNVKELQVLKKGKGKNSKLYKEIGKEQAKGIESKNVKLASKEKKLHQKPNNSIKAHKENIERKLKRENINNTVEKLSQNRQLPIPKKIVERNDVCLSNEEKYDFPENDKARNESLNKEIIKEISKEIDSNDINIEIKEDKLKSSPIILRKLHKENETEKNCKKGIDIKVEALSKNHELYLPKDTFETEIANFSNKKEIDIPQNDNCNIRREDKEIAEDDNREVEYDNISIESNEKVLQPTDSYSKAVDKEKCIEDKPDQVHIDSKDKILPKSNKVTLSRKIVRTNDYDGSNKKVDLPKSDEYIKKNLDSNLSENINKELKNENNNDLPKKYDHIEKQLSEELNKGLKCGNKNMQKSNKTSLSRKIIRTNDYDSTANRKYLPKVDTCINKKLDSKLSTKINNKLECSKVKTEFSKKQLKSTPNNDHKSVKKNCIEKNSGHGNINNKVVKPSQTHVLTPSKKIPNTDDSHLTNIKVDSLKKDKCISGKHKEDLFEEKSNDSQCNNINAESNFKSPTELNENTVNFDSSIKNDVKHISSKNRLSDISQSISKGQTITTLVNHFKRKDITNVDCVFETLKIIQFIVTNVLCEKNILDLSKSFIQIDKYKDTHNEESPLSDTSKIDFSFQTHFKRSVRIFKADEIITSKKINTNKTPLNVSSTNVIKTANTIDPKSSILSQKEESLQITLSDISGNDPSVEKKSEIISHNSLQNKIFKSCTCCKSLFDIKSQLEELFCNNLECEESTDGEQNKEEIEIMLKAGKHISIDDCMQQNAFLKQNLDNLRNTYKKDFEKLTESYICEFEKQVESNKEYKNKSIEDANRVQAKIKVLENLNEFILVENKRELEKQSKRLTEEHKREMEKQRLSHSTQLKKIEECKGTENYICELERKNENLKEQKNKLEEDTIRLKKHITDLEKTNESILIEKKKEIENQYRNLMEEHNKNLDKQRERHITQLKKLEEHKKLLKKQLLEKNRIISKKMQNKKDYVSSIAPAANNSVKRTNSDEDQRESKLLKLESDIEHQSVDTAKGKMLLKEKLEKLTYHPESSCDIVAKVAKNSENKLIDNYQISLLNEKQKDNKESLSFHTPFNVNHNLITIYPSSPLTTQPLKYTTEVVDLTVSPRKNVSSISNEKKRINVEEYRLRNCSKLSKDVEENNNSLTYIDRQDRSPDMNYSKIKRYEERIQKCADNENTCKMCESFKNEIKGYKKKLEELTRELQEVKENRSEGDNDVNTVKADMYSRYHTMKASLEDTNKSMKSDLENLIKSNQQLKTENENLIRSCEDIKKGKIENIMLNDDFKEINDNKHKECEITKENLRQLCEKSQYENKLLKREMDKLQIDLGNSKFKYSAEQTRFKKEGEVKENYINQLQKENVKKDGLLIDKELVIQRLTLIEKRYLELVKDKQVITENVDNACESSEKTNGNDRIITKKNEIIKEIKHPNNDLMVELDISSLEVDNLNGRNNDVREKFKQLEKNSITSNDKINQMSSQLIQNKKENEKLEATANELNILLFEEKSKVKLLETKLMNLEKQQLALAISKKDHGDEFDNKKVKHLQHKNAQLYESLEIDQQVSVKIRRSVRTRIKNRSKMQLKLEEQKQEIMKLNNSFEKEKEAAEYYGKHLYYQRSRNAYLEERLSTVYRDTLRELSIQLCQFDGAAERFRTIMNDLHDLNNNNHNDNGDPTKNNEQGGELVVQNECGLDLSGLNFLAAITDMEKKPVDLNKN